MESARYHSAAAANRSRPAPGTRGSGWHSIWVRQIEDFDACEPLPLLRALPLSAPQAPESIACFRSERIACWSARITRKLLLQGSCRPLRSTVFLALEAPAENRCNHIGFGSGGLALFQPGDQYELCCHPQTLLVCIALPQALLHTIGDPCHRLDDSACRSRGVLAATPEALAPALAPALDQGLAAVIRSLHPPGLAPPVAPVQILDVLLRAAIARLRTASGPLLMTGQAHGQVRVLTLARHYIDARLSDAITVSAVAAAALTSVRTLHRAFSEVLGESMQHYVRVQRLQRIRRTLLMSDQPVTVARVASHWGINEFGRLSGWYRELFGELPSETLLRRRADRAERRLRPPRITDSNSADAAAPPALMPAPEPDPVLLHPSRT